MVCFDGQGGSRADGKREKIFQALSGCEITQQTTSRREAGSAAVAAVALWLRQPVKGEFQDGTYILTEDVDLADYPFVKI